jgi:tellurite resistance protein TehA-like permease
MNKNIMSIIKLSLLIFLILLFIYIVLSFINFNQEVIKRENSIIISFIFLLGVISGLIIKSGLCFIFWYSYNIRYHNENCNDNILKKVVASLIFLIINLAYFWREGMLLVFIICTLTMLIIKHKKGELL